MELQIKELELENKQFEKELKELKRKLEIIKKRQLWYNANKFIFTKSLDDDYKELMDKILNEIKFIEESIEKNFININIISSDRNYILEKIEKQKVYNSNYWDKIRRKKLNEQKYQILKNTCTLFSYDKKTKSMRDILHKKIDGVIYDDSIRTCIIDRDNKYIVEL